MTELYPLAPTTAGAFTAADGDTKWVFAGALTMDSATKVLEGANAMALPSTGIVDFAGLLQADSAALAVMVALRRRAAAERRPLTLAGIPDSLMSLAVVYGIEGLIRL